MFPPPIQRLDPAGTPLKDTYEIAFVLQRSSSDAPVRLPSTSTTDGSANSEVMSKVTVPKVTLNTITGELTATNETSARMFRILDECFHRTSLTSGNENNDIIIQLDTRQNNWQHMIYEHTIDEPGYLHVYFSNCEPDTSLSYDLTLIEYNVNADGTPMYLSAGERYLPSLLVVLACIFGIELIVWSIYLRRHIEHVKTIHYLMLACCFIKMLSVGFEAMKYHSLKAKGVHDGWMYAFYVVSILKSMFLFCVIVLLSTGWSYLKPFLTEKDRMILFATIVVQACVNVASVIVGEFEQGEKGWVTWHDILSILDMACWCMILMPVSRQAHTQIL